MMLFWIAPVILLLALAPTLALMAARLIAAPTRGVLAELDALALPADVAAGARAAMRTAQKTARRDFWADVTAPLVMALALPLVSRRANALPKWLAPWDNNVSINGDGEWVTVAGEQLTAGWQITWAYYLQLVAAGNVHGRYADPDYRGRAYYCRGQRPRSYLARWVWLGWRNRASARAVALGADVAARPELVSGAVEIGKAQPGHFLLRAGGLYQYRSFTPILGGRLIRVRNYGWKLDGAYTQGVPRRVAVTAIGVSFRRGARL